MTLCVPFIRPYAALAALAVCALCAGALAGEAPALGIAAVVNDDIISQLDLDDRVKLAIGTTGLPDTPDVQNRLRTQVLRKLVDEKLQMQAAADNGILVSEDDIRGAIAGVERQNNKPPGSFEPFLASRGLSKLSLYSQLRAQIAWTKLVLKKLRPKAKVSDDEVAQAAALKAGSKEKEVQINMITLPVDKPENDAGVRALADKLVGEIRAGAANFDAVATQFSAGQTGEDGTWVRMTQMEPQVAAAVAKLREGDITDPVRTPSGYAVIRLLGLREAETEQDAADAELALKQVMFALKPDAKKKEVDILLIIAKEVQKNPGTCMDEGVAGFKNLEDADIKVSYMRRFKSELPPAMQSIVSRLEVGQVSDPFATPEGLQLVILCERIDMPTLQKDEQLRAQLMQEKLELEAMKYLRNLRREAFVDIRVK